MRAEEGLQTSTLIAFNTVERLLRGDFFHSVSPEQVTEELGQFPPTWRITGVGTTNWFQRNGELLVDGSVAEPRFMWADPAADPWGTIVELDGSTQALNGDLVSPTLHEDAGCPYFPFAAVAVWDPDAATHCWRFEDGQDVRAAIAEWCASANVGLAALHVRGLLLEVEHQAMCHIPLGGVRSDAATSARKESQLCMEWDAVGFYTANPTIQSMLGFPGSAVHLHGRMDECARGGHWNIASATSMAYVEVRPIHDLSLRIHGLDVAVVPERDLCA